MSHETSPSTQQPYGIARVTRVWQVPALHGVCPARSTGSPLARGEARAEDAVDRCGVDRPHPDDHRRESVSW